jgi:hypothetical protein
MDPIIAIAYEWNSTRVIFHDMPGDQRVSRLFRQTKNAREGGNYVSTDLFAAGRLSTPSAAGRSSPAQPGSHVSRRVMSSVGRARVCGRRQTRDFVAATMAL